MNLHREFEEREASMSRFEEFRERLERFGEPHFPTAEEKERERVRQSVRRLEFRHISGFPLMWYERAEALEALRGIVRYGFGALPGFVAHLRRVSGVADNYELMSQSDESYESDSEHKASENNQ